MGGGHVSSAVGGGGQMLCWQCIGEGTWSTSTCGAVEGAGPQQWGGGAVSPDNSAVCWGGMREGESQLTAPYGPSVRAPTLTTTWHLCPSSFSHAAENYLWLNLVNESFSLAVTSGRFYSLLTLQSEHNMTELQVNLRVDPEFHHRGTNPNRKFQSLGGQLKLVPQNIPHNPRDTTACLFFWKSLGQDKKYQVSWKVQQEN